MKLSSVIVETRNIPNLSDIIKNHMEFLPENTQLIIYCNLENMYLKNHFPNAIFRIVQSMDLNRYNELLTSLDFWKDLNDYDRVLIFQSDSTLLRKGIEEFYEWDYIGASWTGDGWGIPNLKEIVVNFCGNGGLSLRNPKTMISILNSFKRESSLYEDVWICEKMFSNKIGKLAPTNISDKFSCETKFILGTFGVHAINKHLTTEQVNQIMNQYKKQDMMLGEK